MWYYTQSRPIGYSCPGDGRLLVPKLLGPTTSGVELVKGRVLDLVASGSATFDQTSRMPRLSCRPSRMCEDSFHLYVEVDLLSGLLSIHRTSDLLHKLRC
jgi:hypothetical protein